ncbi:glutathione transferase GstA [Erwinia sp. HR93]|uniref:glutathione transferase GstA n=1 Tax=Erwinia sp. HR93 TaxID=3094840 RepID=UPI002ADED7DD|nr:glutathione transferase GstA [Erwinia sp. HR93]MEA1065092.1 glutathione transferase GstA [Erwinia sp. HR93]
MKLYYKAGACSLSPHIVLRETGQDFTLVKVDLASKRTENGDDYLKINPKGQVPALELDDGTLLTEGVAIVQYLADKVPDRQLLAPTNSLTRYHTLEWLSFISSELHKGFVPLFRPDTPEAMKPIARQALEQKLSYVNEELADKQWLTGQRFTIADAYLFTVLRWAYALKLNMTGLTHLDEFMARMKARPSVQTALSAEGL